jgi:uncharacterized protein YbbC (DUF1343 family)
VFGRNANLVKCGLNTSALVKKTWRVPLALVFLLLGYTRVDAQLLSAKEIVVGAEQIEAYLPYIKNRSVAIVGNHTSQFANVHLLDTLLKRGVKVVKLFSPEHGFRGDADAGEEVNGSMDTRTGLPIVSLYGKHKKPTTEDLEGIKVVLFDLQDVGTRFYTYISTMHYVMEACAEQRIPIIVLDRPNPNGHYVDGPILESRFRSFVGMHEVPVVHGMTIGEYAKMINGEGWLSGNKRCDLRVITVQHYDHNSKYQLPVNPSPNLPNMESIYLYPSLCFFEGTIVSIGRGTTTPFQVYGHPKMYDGTYDFTPQSMPGASKHPKFEGEQCHGYLLVEQGKALKNQEGKLRLSWLIEAYGSFSEEEQHHFFNNYFNTLAGTAVLKQQIKEGKTEAEIRKTWAYGIENFKKIREKYLLYKDFEFRIAIDSP